MLGGRMGSVSGARIADGDAASLFVDTIAGLTSGVLQVTVSGGVATPSTFAATAKRIPFGSGSNGQLTDSANLTFDSGVTGGALGVGTSSQVARLEVVTASDTSNGAPASWDNRFATFGVGGASGGAVSISFNQSTNVGFIECLTPGTAYRVLSINNGAVRIDGSSVNTGIGTAASTGSSVLTVGGARTVASAAGAIYDGVVLSGGLTLSGSTNVTTATGVNLVSVPAPTYSNASISVADAATVYVGGPPAASGGMTIIRPYAMWIDNGVFRYDGQIANGGGAAPTFGTIGGSGPTAAAQSGWMKLNIDGNVRFFPVWA